MSEGKIIELENVSYSIGKLQILESVSLSIEKNEIFGLLGPNGAGKSTLLRILSGSLFQQGGKIRVFSREKKINWNQTIGVVPQEPSFYYGFSVKQNLEFFGSLYSVPRGELKEKINLLCDWLRLNPFLKKKAEKLSGGYKRLLNLGCSLLHNPSIIFLDEPTVGLDPQMRHEVWKKIKALKREGKTIIITTHYLTEAQALCDNIAILYKGKILTKGNPRELIEEYGGYRVVALKLAQMASPKLSKAIENRISGTEIKSTGSYLIISFHKKKNIEDLSKIVSLLMEYGYQIEDTTVREPQLEDVFMHLTKSWMK